MIHQFEEWSANLAEMSSMEQLRGAAVGIEASEYINRLPKMNYPELARPVQEALLPALGGVPFGLKHIIKHHIAVWRKYGITPIFVFNGLEVRKGDPTFNASEESARVSAQAWDHYAGSDPSATVQAFAASNLVTAKDLYRFLQTILEEQEVEFVVAPYCAWAQLAYLQKQNVIDTIYGSSEVLLFEVPEIITTWDFMKDEIVWVRRQACLRRLDNIPSESFVDACILSGSDLLDALPQLENNRALQKQPRMKNAADMVMNIGKGSGHNVCLHYRDDQQFRAMDYLDKYRKARLAVKHHVVLSLEGKVEPFKVQEAPHDVHEFIGQRLPDELYYYLSKGVIGTRILNWRTSGEVLETPPLDGGESDEYRKLVRDQLTEMRTSTIGLLSHSLHRFYQHKDLNLRCWFNKDNVQTIVMKGIEDPRPRINSWNVHEDIFGDQTSKLGGGVIGSCVKLLEDKTFAAKTITQKDISNPLKTKDEILFNSMWRLLHLRGYIDEKHNLTAWGQVLHAIIAATSSDDVPAKDLEEGALIAVELARYGLLNANPMFSTYGGAPQHGDDKDKRCTLLVSRVAAFGRFDHQSIGYTGPLSRNMLAYNSLVNAVRSGLRDLAEVCLTTILLNGDADRHSVDLTQLGLELPFLISNDCVLSIAALSHFGELLNQPQPLTQDTKNERIEYEAENLFRYADDYSKQIAKILVIWDALYKGVQTMPSDFKHKSLFEEANDWLTSLR